MKNEILDLIKKELIGKPYSESLFENNKQKADYYFGEFDQVVERFIKMKQKYHFKNISSWTEDPEAYPQLSLFKSMFETSLYLCIDYEGGISESDKELSPFVKDPDIYILPAFENPDDEYDFVNNNNFIHTKLFFTFLTLAWIKANGEECGLVVKILENNSSKAFFLNDLKWDEDSIFQFHSDQSKRVTNQYKSSIKIEQIFNQI